MIFSEIYGTYYNTMAKILGLALDGGITADGLYKAVTRNAYAESVVPITEAIDREKWQLLKFDKEKNVYKTTLKNVPSMPLTTLQRRYLKTVLRDKRARLFDIDFAFFENELRGEEPLWDEGDFSVSDRYADGDDFESAEYIANFRKVLDAYRRQTPLSFTLKNRRGKEFDAVGIPRKIEYSEKDDKFRVMLGGRSKAPTINLGRVVSVERAENIPDEGNAESASLETDTVVLELTDERNALERVLLHFANLKKKTTKVAEDKYRVELEFARDDEAEMVVWLLHFGPVIKVLEPKYMVGEIVRRLGMQLRLMGQGNELKRRFYDKKIF